MVVLPTLMKEFVFFRGSAHEGGGSDGGACLAIISVLCPFQAVHVVKAVIIQRMLCSNGTSSNDYIDSDLTGSTCDCLFLLNFTISYL